MRYTHKLYYRCKMGYKSSRDRKATRRETSTNTVRICILHIYYLAQKLRSCVIVLIDLCETEMFGLQHSPEANENMPMERYYQVPKLQEVALRKLLQVEPETLKICFIEKKSLKSQSTVYSWMKLKKNELENSIFNEFYNLLFVSESTNVFNIFWGKQNMICIKWLVILHDAKILKHKVECATTTVSEHGVMETTPNCRNIDIDRDCHHLKTKNKIYLEDNISDELCIENKACDKSILLKSPNLCRILSMKTRTWDNFKIVYPNDKFNSSVSKGNIHSSDYTYTNRPEKVVDNDVSDHMKTECNVSNNIDSLLFDSNKGNDNLNVVFRSHLSKFFENNNGNDITSDLGSERSESYDRIVKCSVSESVGNIHDNINSASWSRSIVRLVDNNADTDCSNDASSNAAWQVENLSDENLSECSEKVPSPEIKDVKKFKCSVLTESQLTPVKDKTKDVDDNDQSQIKESIRRATLPLQPGPTPVSDIIVAPVSKHRKGAKKSRAQRDSAASRNQQSNTTTGDDTTQPNERNVSTDCPQSFSTLTCSIGVDSTSLSLNVADSVQRDSHTSSLSVNGSIQNNRRDTYDDVNVTVVEHSSSVTNLNEISSIVDNTGSNALKQPTATETTGASSNEAEKSSVEQVRELSLDGARKSSLDVVRQASLSEGREASLEGATAASFSPVSEGSVDGARKHEQTNIAHPSDEQITQSDQADAPRNRFEPLSSIITRLATEDDIPPHVTMRYEMLRLYTLHSYPRENKPYIIRLAQAGFYYGNNQDEVVCYCCGHRRSNWEETDNPMVIHQRMNPHCSFLVRNEEVNVKIIAGGMNGHVSKEKDNVSFVTSLTGASNVGFGSGRLSSGRGIITSTNTTTTSSADPVQAPTEPTTPTQPPRSYGGFTSAPSQSTAGPQQTPADTAPAVATSSGAQNVSTTNVSATSTLNVSSAATTNFSTTSTPNARNPATTNARNAGAQGSDRVTYPQNNFRDKKRIRFKKYIDVTKRRETYEGCEEIAVPIESLIEAGLFYIGYGDCCRCHVCGIGLRHWTVDDDPWVEHARWSKECEYVKTHKGQEFIDLVQMAVEISQNGDATVVNGIVSNGATGNNNIITGPVPTTQSAHAIHQNDIDTTLIHGDAAQSLFEMGYSLDIIKRALRAVIDEQGQSAISAANLMEKIFQFEGVEYTPASSHVSRDNAADRDNAASRDSAGASSRNDTERPVAGAQSAQPVSSAQKRSQLLEQKRLAKENELLKYQSICTICKQNPVCIVFLPCGHLVTCETCAAKVKHCNLPDCKKYIKGTVRTYFS